MPPASNSPRRRCCCLKLLAQPRDIRSALPSSSNASLLARHLVLQRLNEHVLHLYLRRVHFQSARCRASRALIASSSALALPSVRSHCGSSPHRYHGCYYRNYLLHETQALCQPPSHPHHRCPLPVSPRRLLMHVLSVCSHRDRSSSSAARTTHRGGAFIAKTNRALRASVLLHFQARAGNLRCLPTHTAFLGFAAAVAEDAPSMLILSEKRGLRRGANTFERPGAGIESSVQSARVPPAPSPRCKNESMPSHDAAPDASLELCARGTYFALFVAPLRPLLHVSFQCSRDEKRRSLLPGKYLV